jgi:hypothetical protein
MMGGRARGRRLHTGATTIFIALRCYNRGGKAVGPCKRCKKAQ